MSWTFYKLRNGGGPRGRTRKCIWGCDIPKEKPLYGNWNQTCNVCEDHMGFVLSRYSDVVTRFETDEAIEKAKLFYDLELVFGSRATKRILGLTGIVGSR